ncbi:MAG: hypothetical protein ACI8Z5_002623 [Lentimonas sp.]|jgi:hypothetical protein
MQMGFVLSSGLAISQRLPSNFVSYLHMLISSRHKQMLAAQIEIIERHCFVCDPYDWACSLSVPIEFGGAITDSVNCGSVFESITFFPLFL